jgi:outer membrane protein
MKSNKFILVTVCAIILLVLGGMVTYSLTISKVAYIDTEEVYNDFKLKKDLEQKLQRTQLLRQSFLDSLKVRIQILSRQLNDPDPSIKQKVKEDAKTKLEFLQQDYLYKEKTFTEDNEALTEKYTNEIWKQLNQYIKDFGTENKYEFVLGTSGQGNVMYANAEKNITKQIKEYVNSKFEGKK